MGLSNNSEFKKLLGQAIESHLLKEHLSLHLKKSTSPLSQDYLNREQIEEITVARNPKPSWKFSDLPLGIQKKISALQCLLSVPFPMEFEVSEAAQYLQKCLRLSHPDTNPGITSEIFQSVFPVHQELKKYFKNLAKQKKSHRKAFYPHDRQQNPS